MAVVSDRLPIEMDHTMKATHAQFYLAAIHLTPEELKATSAANSALAIELVVKFTEPTKAMRADMAKRTLACDPPKRPSILPGRALR